MPTLGQYPSPIGGKKRILIIHATDGKDSRETLVYGDGRGVGAHYLIGRYDGLPEIVIYKLAPESACVNGAGFGKLGSYDGNINDIALQVEIEGPPFDALLLSQAALLCAEIIGRRYTMMGEQLEEFTHKVLDKRKDDPTFDVIGFKTAMWSYIEERQRPRNGS
jgi:N-acetyl-anhydromuramyl-L-alanine amidase AmpD